MDRLWDQRWRCLRCGSPPCPLGPFPRRCVADFELHGDAPANATGTATINGSATFDGQSVVTGGGDQSKANGPPVISALSPISAFEDAPVRITFTVTDDLTAVEDLVVTARSSNEALAPGSSLVLSRNSGVHGLEIGLVPETAGRTTITVEASDGTYASQRSFDLEISLTNDTPRISAPAAVGVLEDSSVRIGAWGISDPDAGDGTLEAVITVSDGSLRLDSLAGATLHSGVNGGGALVLRGTLTQLNGALASSTLTPAQDHHGLIRVQLSVNDLGNSGGAGPQTGVSVSTVPVTAVNDAPSFTPGPDQLVVKDAGAQTVAAWATGIRSGPANEAGQSVQFAVLAEPASLFSVLPAISADGTLTYTSAPGAIGSAVVTVLLRTMEAWQRAVFSRVHRNVSRSSSGIRSTPLRLFP